METPESYDSLLDDRKASWEAMAHTLRVVEDRFGPEDMEEWREYRA